MATTSTQAAVTDHWRTANERYDAYIQAELGDTRRKVWQTLIDERRPDRPNLTILDSGCGPGFFALLLKDQGHRVVGIDAADTMIATAKSNAEIAEADGCEFHVMDSHDLDFDDDSFDMVIARNASWLLHDPVKAFQEWHRVLTPGGRLAIFDGNWMTYVHNPVHDKNRAVDEERARAAGWTPTVSSSDDHGDDISPHLPLTYVNRPGWDVPVLLRVGFSRVSVESNVAEVVYDPIEKIRYASTTMFAVCAEK